MVFPYTYYVRTGVLVNVQNKLCDTQVGGGLNMDQGTLVIVDGRCHCCYLALSLTTLIILTNCSNRDF